ncbi:MAG: histidinol-phosphate transaminase [Prevotellamassilia sp.]|nr:histidinol-phosphate transaminase [Prevotellamassilia sp.]
MYIRNNIKELLPYSTARDDYKGGDISVWLDANESPYNNGVNRYPDPHQKALKGEIAQLKGVTPEQVFVGNGSDEAIDLCFRIFCEPGVDNVVAIAPTYGMYAVAAAINNVAVREVPLEAGTYALNVPAMLAAADAHTRLMWVCSPNNPTGNAFSLQQLEALADNFGGVLVVDEAYIDFSSQPSMLTVLSKHPNVVVLQTLSKAWGMAGLRLGLAFASPMIADIFARVKYPYNVNAPTQAEVAKRLHAEPHDAHVAEVCSQRQWLATELAKMPCVLKVYHSDANFLLVKVTDADAIYDHLVANGIIVRNRNRVKGCEGCLRITVGTPAENVNVIDALKQYV